MERDKKELAGKCMSILAQYKSAKANLEKRVIDNENWFRMRHWDALRTKGGINPTSGWLFNAVMNKHADAMDNIPSPVVLPREQSDEESAKVLTSILPVIMENNGWADVYDDGWWSKLKDGTAVYGVFWDSTKENGLGDIQLTPIDILKVFWEPGITDIQRSKNLFICELVDKEDLASQYPDMNPASDMGILPQYDYDFSIDTSKKSLVVDWYYKVNNNGKTAVHMVKVCGSEILYDSTEDMTQDRYGRTIAENGLYDHGMYPVIFDTMYPEEGTPTGFGVIAVCKDAQIYIDDLSGSILENARLSTRRRYFASENAGINIKDFLDTTKPIVKVKGELSDAKIKEIAVTPTNSIDFNILQAKINEMKEVVGNRDINNGGSESGATAAAAISAMQESGNKVSRDIIAASYRAYAKIVSMVVELIRQFYDESRTFRIVAPNGTYEFAQFSNASIVDQTAENGLVRRPVFDYKISAEKQNPFSKLQQNQTAKEFYQLGFFNPDNAQQSLVALEMMSFEGKDKVLEQIQQGSNLLEMGRQLSAENEAMKTMLHMQPTQEGQATDNPPQTEVADESGKAEILKASTPMTAYGNKLAGKATVNVNG